jgi:hypothetical protein
VRVLSSVIKRFAFSSSAVLLAACATPSQMYWDHRVKELCEKDGGVTVYEKVELTKEEFNKLDIPFEKHAKPDTPYYRVSLVDVVINDSPRVWKGGQKIVRRSDGKVLGMQIYYARRGGDILTGISESSHYGCEQINNINLDIDKSIFVTN